MEAVTYYQHPARVFTTQVSLPSGTTNFEIAADPGVELPGQNCEFCRNVRVYHWHAQNIQAAGIVLFPIKSQHPGGPHLSLMICYIYSNDNSLVTFERARSLLRSLTPFVTC